MSPIHYTPRRTLVGYSETIQRYNLYNPTSHQGTEHRDVIFDEPFPHGPPRSLSSPLSSDDSTDGSPHVPIDHVSSHLDKSHIDDSQLVVADLSSSPSDVGPPICIMHSFEYFNYSCK